jgi:hypothetical protein
MLSGGISFWPRLKPPPSHCRLSVWSVGRLGFSCSSEGHCYRLVDLPRSPGTVGLALSPLPETGLILISDFLSARPLYAFYARLATCYCCHPQSCLDADQHRGAVPTITSEPVGFGVSEPGPYDASAPLHMPFSLTKGPSQPLASLMYTASCLS